MAKGDIIRAIMKMKHSPAGKKHLAKKKKYTSLATRGVEKRLRDAGLTEKEIKRLRG